MSAAADPYREAERLARRWDEWLELRITWTRLKFSLASALPGGIFRAAAARLVREHEALCREHADLVRSFL
jgi:hypothetical protein